MTAIWNTPLTQRHVFGDRVVLTIATTLVLWIGGGAPPEAAEPSDSISVFLSGNRIAEANLDPQQADEPEVRDDATRFDENQFDAFDDLAPFEESGFDSIYGAPGERQASMTDGGFELPRLIAPTTDISEIGIGRTQGKTPEGARDDQPPPLEDLPESATERGFPSEPVVRTWAAPNTFFNPLYFEDRMLERHGHKRFGHYQSVAAGARFFATVPMLPYLMTVRPPFECEYSLGYFRAGSCAPKLLQRPPYERRAAIVEGASIAGAILALP